MRHIIIWIGIVITGFLICLSIMVAHGVFSSFWSLIIPGLLTGIGFIASILLSPFSFDSGTISTKKKVVFYLLAIVLCLIQVAIGFVFPIPPAIIYCSDASIQQGQSQTLAPIRNGIGVTRADDGEFIGISDGSFAFDTGTASNDRLDSETKCAAARQFATGDLEGAKSSWSDAVQVQEQANDAEEHIYQENQAVKDSGAPYVTIVVSTMLTGNDQGKIGVGRDTLQGIYTAQLEYNNPNGPYVLPNRYKVRVLIANAGSKPAYVTQVVQQIIQLAQKDPTFIGVVGWNFSAYAEVEIPLLTENHIPMILPTTSKDKLLSPYSFRVTPTDSKEAMIGARYVQTYLHAQRILLFADNNDAFSGDLARDFTADYGSQNIVDIKTYTVGNPDTLKGILDNLLVKYNPDLIYFAGYPNDLIALIENQLSPSGAYSSLKIMGGDALYEVGVDYPPELYKRLLFTAAAFPDVWNYAKIPAPPFYTDYAKNFDPDNTHAGQYGWSRADADSILSYDALLALLNGSANAMEGQPSTYQPNPQDVEQGLNNVTPFQGASGLVSLQDDNGSDPSVNKVIVMLTVDTNGKTQIQRLYGCLAQNVCYL